MPDSVDKRESLPMPEFGVKREKMIMEVGHASGMTALLLKETFNKDGKLEDYNYYGVDINPVENVSTTLEWASNIRKRVQDLEGLDNRVDIIWAKDLELGYPQEDDVLVEKKKAGEPMNPDVEFMSAKIDKFYELLKPGGTVVFVLTGYTPILENDRESYASKFEKAGFEVQVADLDDVESPFVDSLKKVEMKVSKATKARVSRGGRVYINKEYAIVATKPR